MFQSRPALRFILLFAGGILLAPVSSLSPCWLFISIGILILFSGTLFWLDNWHSAAIISLQCSVVLLGLLLQLLQQSDCRSRKLEPVVTDEPVTLFGTVDSEPVQHDRRIDFVVSADSIVSHNIMDRKLRRVIVLLRLERGEHVAGEIEFGKKIILQGTVEPFPFQRNPGEFDYGKFLALNDIQGFISAKGQHRVHVERNADGTYLRTWTYSVQQALYHILDSLHSSKHAGFLKGIIFGYRADIPSDVKQTFMDTGTIHILAVSGSNVAFVAFIFFSVLGFLRLPRKIAGALAISGLITYMLITGSSASVVRATIMAIVLLSGTMFERKADIYNSISVAVIILLVWNTNTLFDVGFQLSFAAVFSIVYFYPRLELLIKKIPRRFYKIKVVETGLKLFAVSLAAQLGTIPFIAYYFNRVSIISLAANIIVVPLSGLNTFIGAAEIVFFPISRRLADLYAAANDFLIWFLLGFVKKSANVPFAYLETWHFYTAFVVGYYFAVLGVFNLHLKRFRTWMLILLLIIGNYLILEDIWSTAHPSLTVTVIDVGQGDAILIEFPNGKHLLIDSGPSSLRFDAGMKTVVPFLKRKGITRIDYFLITHPHSDHIGGAASVLNLIQVDTLITSSNISDNRQMKEIFNIAQINNVGVRVIFAGSQISIDQETRVYTLYPERNQSKQKNLNNSSIVLKVLFGGSSILFVGDAEVDAERQLISRYGMYLSSGILKAGHHGSITSSSDEFLRYAHPQVAIISVGYRNKFRHPSSLTTHRFIAHSIKIDRTDKMGAVVWKSDGTKWTKSKWRP